jgi:uncharacterized protein
MSKKTVVLGASANTERYSFKAVEKLQARKHEVVAIGNKIGSINTVPIVVDLLPVDGVHTITLYLSEKNQKIFYEYIFSLQPKRIIFNPGAENAELASLAAEKGIAVLDACTLVMLATNQY